jgi:hypothetical protein
MPGSNLSADFAAIAAPPRVFTVSKIESGMECQA